MRVMVQYSIFLQVAFAYGYRAQHDYDDAGASLTSSNLLFPIMSDKIGESILEINPHLVLNVPRSDMEGPFTRSSTENFDLGPNDALPRTKGVTLMVDPRKDRLQGKVTVDHYTSPTGGSVHIVVPHNHATTLLEDGTRRAVVRVMTDDDLDPVSREARSPTRLVSSESRNVLSHGLLQREHTSLLDNHARQNEDTDDFNYICDESPPEPSTPLQRRRKQGMVMRAWLGFKHMLGRTLGGFSRFASQKKEQTTDIASRRWHRVRGVVRRYNCRDDEHCRHCRKKYKCGKCELNYGLAKGGYDSCGKCPSGCAECHIAALDPESSTGQCDRCLLNYIRKSGACVEVGNWRDTITTQRNQELFFGDRTSKPFIEFQKRKRQQQLSAPLECNFVIRSSDLGLITGNSWQEETDLVMSQYEMDDEEKSGVTLSSGMINGEGPRVKRISETKDDNLDDDDTLAKMKSGTSRQAPLSFVGISTALVLLLANCL
eukprot:GEMP01020459.1.p1 GENE.GEMP01020459.1~~GEMP01020459.1.p1  ORF type:complete len:487 (-),score=91.89 GEMP01020459.1:802-2262(-)